MSDLHEAYKKLKAANPLAAALLTSGQLRATVYGLALIDRALEPTAEESAVVGELEEDRDALA